MSDDYTNPIDEKMTGYANRMRELVLEAYAEGIVLGISTHDQEDGALTENQRLRRIVTAIPETGHVHPQLRKPCVVAAQAVIEIKQTIVPPIQTSLHTPRRLIPAYHAASACCFVDSNFVEPWFVGDAEYKTSALKFGLHMDLLALSHVQEEEDQGKIDRTDIIGSEVSLNKVFYRMTSGVVREFNLNSLRGTNFVPRSAGDEKNLYLDYEFSLPFPHTGTIRILGQVEREYGRTVLTAGSSDPDIMPLGFTLNATRIKPIR